VREHRRAFADDDDAGAIELLFDHDSGPGTGLVGE
jgi:hypothetical protein